MKKTALIAILTDCKTIEKVNIYSVAEQYIKAIYDLSGILPIMIPCYSDQALDNILDNVNGILLPGSISNIFPQFYGKANIECDPYDKNRDQAAFALIRGAISKSIPLLAICRGMQELNVCLGGSLNANIQDIEGNLDHREVKSEDRNIQYTIRQKIAIKNGGELDKILGKREILVNSLHSQAIDRLADDLSIEALAEDGTIEAVSLKNGKSYLIGVQFHPEYWVEQDQNSHDIMQSFIKACQENANRKYDQWKK